MVNSFALEKTNVLICSCLKKFAGVSRFYDVIILELLKFGSCNVFELVLFICSFVVCISSFTVASATIMLFGRVKFSLRSKRLDCHWSFEAQFSRHT